MNIVLGPILEEGIVGEARPIRVGERAPLPHDVEPSTTARQETAEEALSVNDTGLELADPGLDPMEQRVLGDINLVQRAWFVNNLFGGDYRRFFPSCIHAPKRRKIGRQRPT